MPEPERPSSPARLRAQLARLNADLAGARKRRSDLELCSGAPGEVELELTRADARIAELEADLEEVAGATAAPAPSPANDTVPPLPAPALPEYLTTRQAAALLGVTVKHLETLRARGKGSPFVRVGHAVRYPAAELRRQK